MNGLLTGKRMVITGAARGLGFHFAKACAEQGADVVMCDILQGELAESAHRLREQGYRIESQTIDLADASSIEEAFLAIGERGKIDGLVNNAAMATGVGGKNMIDYDPDLWDRVMSVNVKGTWLVTRAAVPLLREGAGIVNVASDTALWGRPPADGLCCQQRGGDRHDALDGPRAGRKAYSDQRDRPRSDPG